MHFHLDAFHDSEGVRFRTLDNINDNKVEPR
jgi:hypothetical protein